MPDDERFDLHMVDIAGVWRWGRVISSWLRGPRATTLASDPPSVILSGYAEDSSQGRWSLQAGIEEPVQLDVLATALFAHFRSRQEHNFGEKMLSAMRLGFGGHIEVASSKGADNV